MKDKTLDQLFDQLGRIMNLTRSEDQETEYKAIINELNRRL